MYRENHNPKVYMHPIHCSTLYNSQDVEATQMSIDRVLYKENVVHIYLEVLFSHTKNEIMLCATT